MNSKRKLYQLLWKTTIHSQGNFQLEERDECMDLWSCIPSNISDRSVALSHCNIIPSYFMRGFLWKKFLKGKKADRQPIEVRWKETPTIIKHFFVGEGWRWVEDRIVGNCRRIYSLKTVLRPDKNFEQETGIAHRKNLGVASSWRDNLWRQKWMKGQFDRTIVAEDRHQIFQQVSTLIVQL